jgi:hypothetical protein
VTEPLREGGVGVEVAQEDDVEACCECEPTEGPSPSMMIATDRAMLQAAALG